LAVQTISRREYAFCEALKAEADQSCSYVALIVAVFDRGMNADVIRTDRMETCSDSLTENHDPPWGKIRKENKVVKRGLCTIALAAALIPFAQPAAAQNITGTPKPTVQDYGPFGHVQFKNTAPAAATSTSGKCGNPAASCLFYGGDFLYDPLFPPTIANGLASETTLEVQGTPYGAAVWVPFTVPAGQTWYVTGLFTNDLATYGVLDQGTQPTSVAFWSINESVFAGSAGTVIDSGTSPATSTPTGRSAFGDYEYTVQVKGLSITLKPGSYWMSVVPICTNAADPYCDGVFFLSDVEYINSAPKNAYGPAEPLDASYFDSPYFGLSFNPTYGPVGACDGDGCDAFSAGVLGIEVK
jgi:hypothetical protein